MTQHDRFYFARRAAEEAERALAAADPEAAAAHRKLQRAYVEKAFERLRSSRPPRGR